MREFFRLAFFRQTEKAAQGKTHLQSVACTLKREQQTSSPIIGDYSLGGNRFVVYALRVSEAWRIHYELDAFFIVAVGAVRERPLHV